MTRFPDKIRAFRLYGKMKGVMRLIDPLEYKGTGFFEGAPSYPRRIRLERLVFVIVWAMFAKWTLPRFSQWRRHILVAFGAKISPTANVFGSVKIWHPKNLRIGDHTVIGPGVTLYSMAPIDIGRYVVISQRSHLCCGSHDTSKANFQIKAKAITVKDNAWICAEAFVGPGTTIGEGAVLSARAVTFKSLKDWTIYSGNPAVPIRERQKFQR